MPVLGAQKQTLLNQVKNQPTVKLQTLVDLVNKYDDLMPDDFKGYIDDSLFAELKEAGRDPKEMKLWNEIQNTPRNSPEAIQEVQRNVAAYIQQFPMGPKVKEAQSLMSGLDAVIPIRFGTLYVIVNLLLLSFALVFDRHKIGLATLINLFLLGYIAEFSQKCCEMLFPAAGLAGRLVLLAAAIVIMCLASAFYFTADLGVSTYDAVSLIVADIGHFRRDIDHLIGSGAAFGIFRQIDMGGCRRIEGSGVN